MAHHRSKPKLKTDATTVAETIRSLRGKYKHLGLMETHQAMKREEKELEETKFRRLPGFASRPRVTE